jgi:phage baseplate assembly protein gpV
VSGFLAARFHDFVYFVWEEMMISRTWSRKSIAFCVAVAVLSVYSMVTLAAAPQKASGELSVSGQVTVNGQAAISGATIFSDSVIATAAGSNATISLGKLGRVELFPNSSVKLSFAEGNISGALDAGRVQVSTLAGTSAIVTAKDGAAVADAGQAATFMVDVECGNMIVASQAGQVELRAGGKAKAVAAGTSESAGTPQPGTRCTRLTRPDTFGHLSGGALAALLLAAGGAVAAAIFAANHDDTLNFGGSVTVVSPTR